MESSEQPNQKPPDWLERFTLSPEGQRIISDIIAAISKNSETKLALAKMQVESQSSATRGATKWMLVWTVALALIVVIPISILAWNDKMSSDATAFLFGAIVGAAFTFLRGFFPHG